MQAVGVFTHVNRAYEQSEAHQWAREAVVNSIQAGAKHVHFGIEWQAVKQKNVYRRLIADDGCGMTAQQMPAFLNKYGGSGRIIGDITGNYGIGLKTSTLPWNAHGLIVLSVVTDETGHKRANMMWLCRSADNDGNLDYGARELMTEEFGDEDDFIAEWTSKFESASEALAVVPLDLLEDYGFEDCLLDGIDWMKVIPDFVWEAGHGTVVVFMGDTGAEDTVKGDPHRDAENTVKYGLALYLNSRFYRLPPDVTISVVSMESRSKTGNKNDWQKKELWPTKPSDKGVNKRTIIGMESCLQRYIETAKAKNGKPYTATVVLNGDSTVPARVTTYLYPDIGVSKPGQDSWTGYQAGDQPSIPLFACIHEAHPGIVEAFAVQTHSRGKVALYPWVNTDVIRRRLAIVVEPTSTDQTKVFPDPSRRTLHYQDRVQGGADMPIEEWTNLYQQKRPDFITKAIDEFFAAFTTQNEEIDEDLLRRVGDQYLPYMRMVTLKRRGRKRRVTKEPDDEAETVIAVGGGGGGPRVPSVDCQRGGKNHSVPYGLLDANLIDMPVDPADKTVFPLQKNSDRTGVDKPAIEIRYRHPMIQSAWQACRQRLIQKNGVPLEQIDVYEKAFYREVKIHVQLATTHLWHYVRGGRPELRDKLFSPEALTSVVAGIRPLQQAAQGIFGTIKAGKEAQ